MKKILFSSIILLIAQNIFSQEKEYANAHELITNGYYHKALPLAEQLSKYKNSDAAQWMLGYIHFKLRNYTKAIDIYQKVKSNRQKRNVIPLWYYLQMAEYNAYNKKFDEAIKYLQQARTKIEELPQKEYEKYIQRYVNDLNIWKDVNKQLADIDYELKRMNYLNGLYQNKNKTDIEVEKFEKVTIKQKGIFTGIGNDQINQELVSIKLNTDEGIEINPKDKFKTYYQPYGFKFIENDNRTLPALRSHFYTAGIEYDPLAKKYIYSKQHTQVIELKKKQLKTKPKNYRNYMAFFASDKIEENATLVDINYENSDFIHPAITENGKVLYFSTNKGNENLQFDIAYVKRKSGNEWDWDNITILGEKINTPMNELYPTLSGDTLLTFASNGYNGYGGYDIIGIRLNEGLPIGEPFIYPQPVNSHRDDFGYKYEQERVATFFSNRDSILYDEKYRIEYPLPFVSLIVKFNDKNTNAPIDFATVTIRSSKGDKKLTLKNGILRIDSLLAKDAYEVEIDKEKFIISNKKQKAIFEKNQKELVLEFKGYKMLEKKDKLEFRDILFEYDKADLLPQSYVELDKILQIIKDNPYAKFELSAHTDSRGKDNYNLKLSQKRAESCVNYLLSKGVPKESIIAKGYGEKQLKNNCGNNSKCSEEEHAINRRVEIKVIDIKQ